MVKNQCYTHVPVSGSKRFGGSRVRAERLCGCSEGGDGNSGARSVASVGTRAIGACLLTRARWRQSCWLLWVWRVDCGIGSQKTTILQCQPSRSIFFHPVLVVIQRFYYLSHLVGFGLCWFRRKTLSPMDRGRSGLEWVCKNSVVWAILVRRASFLAVHAPQCQSAKVGHAAWVGTGVSSISLLTYGRRISWRRACDQWQQPVYHILAWNIVFARGPMWRPGLRLQWLRTATRQRIKIVSLLALFSIPLGSSRVGQKGKSNVVGSRK